MSNGNLYTIDTESDKPGLQQPQPVPALIQIQAIHNEKKLYQLIFCSTNRIMTCGNIINGLRSFRSFNLLDILHVTNTVNLPQDFTNEWNKEHPHTDCVARRMIQTQTTTLFAKSIQIISMKIYSRWIQIKITIPVSAVQMIFVL